MSFGFVDDGMSRAGFRTWLTQIRPLVEALGSAEIGIHLCFCGCDPGRETRVCAAASAAFPASLEAYFRMRQEIEEKRLAGPSQQTLDRYRGLAAAVCRRGL